MRIKKRCGNLYRNLDFLFALNDLDLGKTSIVKTYHQTYM